MTDFGEINEVRRDPNPVRRAVRATKLITKYQEATSLLASIRREAVEEAYHDLGMTYTEVANALGLTKGRVTQIRHTPPPPSDSP